MKKLKLKQYFYKTPTQKTKNCGYHIIFSVTEEQMKNLPVSRTGLILDDIHYNVDVKFKNFENNTPQYLNCEPTPGYTWINNNFEEISELPEQLIEIITSQTSVKKKLQK